MKPEATPEQESYRHMKDDLMQLRALWQQQGELIEFMIGRLEEENAK